MEKRKRYTIDKPFQVRHALLVVGIVSIVSVAIVASLAGITMHNSSRLARAMNTQDDILSAMMAASSGRTGSIEPTAIHQMANHHFGTLTSMKGIIRSNTILMLALTGIALCQSLVLAFVLIRKTHRISGPLFVMSNYMKDIIGGKLPTARSIRRNDDLQEFYSLFSRMIDSVKNRR